MNLIDKDALIAKLQISEECSECKWVNGPRCKRYKTFVDACEAIFEAPVIEQPETIYCKDCKWCEDADGLMCKNPASWVVATGCDFGCVLAERRQDE